MARPHSAALRKDIRLSTRQQRRFVALMVKPPKPNRALDRAAAAHAKLIRRECPNQPPGAQTTPSGLRKILAASTRWS